MARVHVRAVARELLDDRNVARGGCHVQCRQAVRAHGVDESGGVQRRSEERLDTFVAAGERRRVERRRAVGQPGVCEERVFVEERLERICVALCGKAHGRKSVESLYDRRRDAVLEEQRRRVDLARAGSQPLILVPRPLRPRPARKSAVRKSFAHRRLALRRPALANVRGPAPQLQSRGAVADAHGDARGPNVDHRRELAAFARTVPRIDVLP
mmetsp:Transcript_7153/g.25038  ORF Transcript_7153/g.25038 Transcript_7153/m.25038 type:complete len:213 (-) Transcript_7153:171-809(-)